MSGRNTTSYIPVPQKINGFGDLGSNTIIKKIYIGRCYHGYPSVWLLDNQGRVYSWGYNQYGQLGTGNSTNQNVPKLVPMSVTAPIKDIYVTGGIYAASFLIGTNGILYAAGETNSSVLTSNASTHQPVMPWGWNKTVKKIFSCETPGTWEGAGTYRRYGAVLDNGELWMWGDQGGYVGDGFGIGYGPASFQGNTIFPIKCLDDVKDAQAVAAGYHMSLALMNDGTVKWTGYNGQYIGGSSGISRTTWETLGASYLTNVTKLRLYGYSTYQTAVALRSDGKVVVWGFGGSGQVGNGNNLTPNAPNSFLLLDKTVVDFSVSGYFGAGSGALYCLTSDGQVMVNGYGAHSMDGDDDQESRFAPSPVIF
jgi:alpha-tubulin suppressor-like RCC1 family protein